LELKAGRDKTAKETTDFTIELHAASDFQRLYEALADGEAIQDLGVADDDIWGQLMAGEIIEVRALVSQPKIIKMLAIAELFKGMLPTIQSFGAQIDVNSLQQMSQIDKLLPLFQSGQVSLIVAVAGSPKYRFVCSLHE